MGLGPSCSQDFVHACANSAYIGKSSSNNGSRVGEAGTLGRVGNGLVACSRREGRRRERDVDEMDYGFPRSSENNEKRLGMAYRHAALTSNLKMALSSTDEIPRHSQHLD